jgi:hypothetical protein
MRNPTPKDAFLALQTKSKPLKILPVLYGGLIDNNLARMDFWEFRVLCSTQASHQALILKMAPPFSVLSPYLTQNIKRD